MEQKRWYESVLEAMQWHSSPIDWCEPNYAVSSSVVEFYNTISNGIFVILPAVLMLLFHPYSKRISNRIHIVWAMMIVIGITSAYFHGTLTLAGQLLDEFSIIWMCATCMAFYFPKKLLPTFLQEHRSRFELIMLVLTMLITYLGCLWPFLNSFIMMISSIPIVLMVRKEMKLSDDTELRYIGKHSVVCWILAAVVWVTDRFTCGLWLDVLNLPGGHWLWHLIIAMSSYRAVIFFIYREATIHHSHTQPSLKYWPKSVWRGVAFLYIAVEPGLPGPAASHLSTVSSEHNNNVKIASDNHRPLNKKIK